LLGCGDFACLDPKQASRKQRPPTSTLTNEKGSIMDISADKSKSDSKRSKPFLAVLQTIRGFIGELIGFFTLTEEECLEAGVVIGNQRRDE
jgi:hypothetical protein